MQITEHLPAGRDDFASPAHDTAMMNHDSANFGAATESRQDARATARSVDVPTLTKAELAEMLFEQVGLNKRESKDMVEAFFDVIREALEQGDSVKLSGFGNFQLRDKPQRPGRNPKTGEVIPITARRVVTFHASQKLKALVEERATSAAATSAA